MPEKRFDAFISYSHQDQKVAERFQAALETYARPWFRTRSLRTFRDTSNLDATPSLWGAVQTALDQSRYLIVLASPASAVSGWVNQEIEHWLASNSHETLIIVRLQGQIRWTPEDNDFDAETSDALPRVLRRVFESEPLIIDLSSHVALRLSDPSFRRAVAQVSARIRGIPLDEIIGEHLRRKRQTRWVMSIAVLMVVALTVFGGVTLRRSLKEGWERQIQANLALSRSLTIQSREALERREARIAIAAALEALDVAQTREAKGAILDALIATQHMLVDVVASDLMVDAVAIDPQGKFLITGDQTGTVVFRDLKTGEVKRTHGKVHAPNGAVSIAISPDGRVAATGGGAQAGFIVWDLDRIEPVFTLSEAPGFSLAFMADGSHLFAGGDNGVILAWNVQDQGVARWQASPEDGTITDIAVHPSEPWFVTGGLYGQARIRDLLTLESIQKIDPDPSTGVNVDISADASLVLMSGGGAVQIWDIVEKAPYDKPIAMLHNSLDHARFLGNISDPILLTSGGELHLWDTEPYSLGFHNQDIISIDCDRASGLVASGARDGRVRVWSLHPKHSFVTAIAMEDNDLYPNAVAVTPDGTQVALASSDLRVQFLHGSNSTRAVIRIMEGTTRVGPVLKGHDGAVVDLEFSVEGLLASASHDGTLRLWDIRAGTSRIIDTGRTDKPVIDVAFSPGGGLLAFAQVGEPPKIVDVQRNTIEQVPVSADVTALVFTDKDGELLFGTAEGEIRLWTPQSKTIVTVFPAVDGDPVRGLAFDGENHQMIALIGKVPYIISMEEDPNRRREALDIDSARSIAVGGSFAFVLDYGEGLSVWDLSVPAHVATLHDGMKKYFLPSPRQVAVSSDGTKVAATLMDGLRIFDLGDEAIRSRACVILSGDGAEDDFERLCAPVSPRGDTRDADR